jgi:hypothetical protein
MKSEKRQVGSRSVTPSWKQAHLLKGDFDLCKQDLQKALSIEPTNNDVSS